MTEAPDGLVFPDPELRIFDVAQSAELAVTVLGKLGLVGDFDAAQKYVAQGMQSLRDAIESEMLPFDSGFEPFVSLQLTSPFQFEQLIEAYDTKYNEESRCSQVLTLLWNQYSAAELNARMLDLPKGEASSMELTALALPLDQYSPEGLLMFRNHTLPRQATLVAGAQKDYGQTHSHSKLLVMNPIDYLLLSAQRIESDSPPLDDFGSTTRFIQLEPKKVNRAENESLTPTASTSTLEARIIWGGDPLLGAEKSGVRLVVGTEEA